jgi:tRNA isopentenyl-2-thiomethyl-A-37 hydroxylase MiaE
MTFEFNVLVPLKTFYVGELEIEAKNYQSALDIIKKLSKEEIDDRTTNWEIDLTNIVSISDDLKVYDKENNILN